MSPLTCPPSSRPPDPMMTMALAASTGDLSPGTSTCRTKSALLGGVGGGGVVGDGSGGSSGSVVVVCGRL